jgi:hypothetical protein
MDLKHSLLFINSSNRIKENTNILSSEQYNLTYESIKLFENSSIAEISIPDHNFSLDDIITINGVSYEEFTGYTDIKFFSPYMSIDISSNAYLFINNQTIRVQINQINNYIFNNILIDNINKLYDSIHIINNSYFIIPLYNTPITNQDKITLNITFTFDNQDIFTENFVCQLHPPSLEILLPESFDIVKKSSIIKLEFLSPETLFVGMNISKLNSIYETLILDSSKLLIPLDTTNVFNISTYNKKIKISILEIHNININMINADFPTIDDQRKNGSHQIISMNKNNIYIDIGTISTSNYIFKIKKGTVTKIKYQKLTQDHNNYDLFLYKTIL